MDSDGSERTGYLCDQQQAAAGWGMPAASAGGCAADGVGGLVEGVGVALDDVDLPGLVAPGPVTQEDLVLDGVAAGGILLGRGGQGPRRPGGRWRR